MFPGRAADASRRRDEPIPQVEPRPGRVSRSYPWQAFSQDRDDPIDTSFATSLGSHNRGEATPFLIVSNQAEQREH